ncbi:ribokinase [Pseudonocardiaceae bacterium YIM PH 21723]|nr:ribokinase [Pseudonocardiaceae bacterium YIM PH 21723]
MLVVGSANADLVVEVDTRPGAGETVLGSDLRTLSGGKGANQAVAAAKLGASVSLLAAVGADAHGRFLLSELDSAGVNIAAVRESDRPTGVALITVTEDGENSIVVAPGANSALSVADVDAQAAEIGAAKVLLGSAEVPARVLEHAVDLAVSAGVRPVLNLAPATALSGPTLAALDPLVVNEHEAAWLLSRHTGADLSADPEELAKGLGRLGVRSLVITLGARGALIAEGGRCREIPAPPVRAVDTTGAGDAFCGALAVRLAAGATLADAAAYAVRVAAISVTRPGAQSSYPRAEELS